MNTKKIEIPTGLSAVLYGLYHVDNVGEDETYKKLPNYISTNLNKEEQLEYRQALDWAAKNPDFNFNSTLPNLRKTNDEILIYLKKYRQFSGLFTIE